VIGNKDLDSVAIKQKQRLVVQGSELAGLHDNS
jgi:hypothetical protein